MTCLTVIGGENIWKERAIASGFCETADGSVPKSKVNSFLRDFFKFVCANSFYCGGPKTLLTDQHLLRTHLFFVTETSELRLAGLLPLQLLVDPFWLKVVHFLLHFRQGFSKFVTFPFQSGCLFFREIYFGVGG